MKILRALSVIPPLLISSVALAKSDTWGTRGRLEAWDSQLRPLGRCPLKHTDVEAELAGFVARVTVRQQFHNPFDEKIEAVYVFPLSERAAVDRMTMRVGNRTIRGEIRERNEGRQIYQRAKTRGHVASLLDQERPNIFTQSVANIEPGEQVDITISYVETLTCPAFQQTLERLSRLGPCNKDAVYNFHVTLLLQNLGDSAWDTWNRQLRGQLVDSQVKSGDEAGSWWQPDDVRAALAGRLFQTALNAMILEVYYRHLPLFQ